jgi:hypothetical protein
LVRHYSHDLSVFDKIHLLKNKKDEYSKFNSFQKKVGNGYIDDIVVLCSSGKRTRAMYAKRAFLLDQSDGQSRRGLDLLECGT